MRLNKKQEEVINWINNPPARMCLVTGYAGTGKTTTIQEAIRRGWSGNELTISAPTHKALKVLKSKIGEWPNVQYRTVASILHQLPDIAPDGSVQYYPRGGAMSGGLLIVDEASMIGWREFNDLQKLSNDTPIILFGDKGQLPPVKESSSKCFDVTPCIDLCTVYRQKGSLVGYLSQLRDPANGWATLTEGPKVSRVGVPDFSQYRWDWIRDPDRYRILCWTNAEVAKYNDIILNQLIGVDWGFFEGQPVMTGSAVSRKIQSGGTKLYIPASTEMTVLSVRVKTIAGFPALELETDLTHSRMGPLRVLNPRYQEDFEASISGVKAEADHWQQIFNQGDRSVDRKRRRAWATYYQALKEFDDIRSCFALTVHRAQGSQYRWGCISADVDRAPLQLHNKLVYTAASRFVEGFTYL